MGRQVGDKVTYSWSLCCRLDFITRFALEHQTWSFIYILITPSDSWVPTLFEKKNNNLWNWFNVSRLSFILVKHTVQIEWLHSLRQLKKKRARGIVFNTKLPLKDYILYWSFSYLKYAPEIICETFDFSKEKSDRKICKNFPTIHHKFFLSTKFNHKIFLSQSSDWCPNAADCRTSRFSVGVMCSCLTPHDFTH